MTLFILTKIYCGYYEMLGIYEAFIDVNKAIKKAKELDDSLEIRICEADHELGTKIEDTYWRIQKFPV